MFPRLPWALITGALLLFTSASQAADGPSPDRAKLIFDRDWIAESTTAMGVTGDARLTPTSIVFNHRVTFKLRYVSELTASRRDLGLRTQKFSLFEVVDPRRQEIAHGNYLCGTRLLRYLAVGIEPPWEGDDNLSIVAFATERPPADAVQDEGLCGSFGYFTKR